MRQRRFDFLENSWAIRVIYSYFIKIITVLALTPAAQ
jgi:hypothetical protein